MLDCYCDFDPPEFWSSYTPTARCEHRCEECSGIILPGEKYEYVAGKWDGYFDTFKTCERCYDLRTWVQNNLPCFCWSHGSMIDDAKEAIEMAREEAPEETLGLKFGFLRRLHAVERRKARILQS